MGEETENPNEVVAWTPRWRPLLTFYWPSHTYTGWWWWCITIIHGDAVLAIEQAASLNFYQKVILLRYGFKYAHTTRWVHICVGIHTTPLVWGFTIFPITLPTLQCDICEMFIHRWNFIWINCCLFLISEPLISLMQ